MLGHWALKSGLIGRVLVLGRERFLGASWYKLSGINSFFSLFYCLCEGEGMPRLNSDLPMSDVSAYVVVLCVSI